MTTAEFEELFGSLMAEEILNLKEQLENEYIRQDILYMNQTDFDDIYFFNKSWQERMRRIITDE